MQSLCRVAAGRARGLADDDRVWTGAAWDGLPHGRGLSRGGEEQGVSAGPGKRHVRPAP